MNECTIGGGCSADTPVLSVDHIREGLKGLHADWLLGQDGKTISRRVKVKGFAKAVYLANLAAFLADRAGHHPDVCFGWGYCQVSFTSHEAGGVTAIDLECAKTFDAAAS